MDQTVARDSIAAPAGAPEVSVVDRKPRRSSPLRWIGVLAALGATVLAAIAWEMGLFQRHIPVALQLSGNIEAHESVLSFQDVQSKIVELPFDEGASVKRGEIIARVDDSDYRQQVRMAEAAVAVQQQSLASAKRNVDAARRVLLSDRADLEYKTVDYHRMERLLPNGAVSADSRDLARAAMQEAAAALGRDQALLAVAGRNVELAKANVRNALQALKLAGITEGYTTLAAPFDGVILVRQAELGEVVSPGTPIFTLADINHVWLRAYVNETDVGRIRLGEPAIVTTDNYPGKRYRGRVSFIAEQAEFTPKSVETHAERVTLVYRVRIDIDNPTHELVPGMPADAQLQLLH
jgi:HlyD family secretion protein